MNDSMIRGSATIWLDESWNILHLDPGAASLFNCLGNEYRGKDMASLPGDPILVDQEGVPISSGFSQMRNYFHEGRDVWKGTLRFGGPESGGYGFPAEVKAGSRSHGIAEGYVLSLSPRTDNVRNQELDVDQLEIKDAWDAVGRPIFLLSTDGLILAMNEYAIRNSAEPKAERLLRPIWEGLDWKHMKDERESLRLHVLRAINGQVQQMIIRQGRRFSSPERSILLITITPIKSDEGAVKRLILDEWYVPVALQMEIKMSMTESIFRTFLDQSPLPTWMTDPHGKLIAMSQTYAQFFGLSSDDIGKDLMQLIPHRFVLQYTRQNEMVMQTGQHLHVLENWMAPDGQVHTHIVHKFPIRTGRDITMIGAISFEVTEKLKVEDGIRAGFERYNLANKATHDLIWDWDIDTDIVTLHGNPDILWTTGDKQVHSPKEFFGKMHPDDRERIERHLLTTLGDPSKDSVVGSYLFSTDEGSYIQILDRAVVVRDDHGRATRVVGSAMQVTRTLKDTCNRIFPTGHNYVPVTDHILNLEERLQVMQRELDQTGSMNGLFSMSGLKELLQQGWDYRILLALVRPFISWSHDKGARHFSVYGEVEESAVIVRMTNDLMASSGEIGSDDDLPVSLRQAMSDAGATFGRKDKDTESKAWVISFPIGIFQQ